MANGALTADPVLEGAFTGGQLVAHAPLHTDLVDASGVNEESVKPLEFVSTVTPPTFAVFKPAVAAAAEV